MYDYTRYIDNKPRVKVHIRAAQYFKRNYFKLILISIGIFIIWAYNSTLYYEEPEINALIINGDSVYLPID